jgi:GTP-binding protein
MQLPTKTPQFVFFNMPQYVKEPYKRYLENKIRDNWDFSGVPIDIYIRENNFYFHIYIGVYRVSQS